MNRSKAIWIGDTHKTCLKCGEMKPIGEYYLKGSMGRPKVPTSQCKACTIKKQLEWYYQQKSDRG